MADTIGDFGDPARPGPQLERVHSQHYARPFGARRNPGRLSRALGWFSIGIGLAALLAPRVVAKAVGVRGHGMVLRAVGVREIVSGIGVLSKRAPAAGLGMRLAGDAMDLVLLNVATRFPESRRSKIARTAAAVVGVTALDLLSSRQQQKRLIADGLAPGESRVEKSITINRSPDDCYRFWRKFENFPRFMKHVESVRVLTPALQETESLVGQRSLWRAKGPAGIDVEWQADVITDRAGEELAWRSVASTDVDNAGSVRFERAPGGHGTVLRVSMSYRPLRHRLAALMAKIFGEEPDRRVEADLRRVKQLLETGEIATTEGQPSGARGPLVRLLTKGVES